MKEELTEDTKIALSKYRIDRAKATINEVETLKKVGYYSTAINRMYYACYYAASALLVRKGIVPTSHAGVKQQLGVHFILEDKISKELGRYYSILFERRHSSDYDDFVFSGVDEVIELYPKALEFIETSVELLDAEDW